MKKTKLLFALSLASITALTGCKGSKITGEDAIKRADEINENANYGDVKAFSMTTTAKGTEDGKKVSMKSVLKYDSEKKVAYSYTKQVNDGDTTISEEYFGVSDGIYYHFDAQAKTYTMVSGLDTIVNGAWEAATTLLFAGVLTSTATAQTALLTTVKANESLADDKKSADLVAYSSGKKSMTIESVTVDNSDEKNKTTTTTYIKDNKLSKVTVKSNDYSTKTTYKYSASVKLPSTSGYTKK